MSLEASRLGERSREFQVLLGGLGPNGSSPADTRSVAPAHQKEFHERAKLILLECQEAKVNVDEYDDMVSSLDMLKPVTEEPLPDKFGVETGASTALRNKIKSLRGVITDLEAHFKKSFRGPDEQSAYEHCVGVILYLLDVLMQLSRSYQQIESSRVQRESSIKELFRAPDFELLPDVKLSSYRDLTTPRKSFQLLGSQGTRASRTRLAQESRAPAENGTCSSKGVSCDNLSENYDRLEPATPGYNVQVQLEFDSSQVSKERERLKVQEMPFKEILRNFNEIRAMIQTFSTEVTHQSSLCDNISGNIVEGVESIDEARKQLIRTAQKSSAYRFYVVLLLLGASFFLIFFDLINSSTWL